MTLPSDRSAWYLWSLLAAGMILPRPRGFEVWTDPAVLCSLLWLMALVSLCYELILTGKLRWPQPDPDAQPECFASDFATELASK